MLIKKLGAGHSVVLILTLYLGQFMNIPDSPLPPSESELIGKLREGDKQAFEQLYHLYSPRLYVNIFKMVKDEFTTEELIQELFTRIWHRKADLNIETDFLSYLYRTAQNLVHDFYRRLQRDRKMLEHFKSVATVHDEDVEKAMYYKESTHFLKQALEQLSPQQRAVYQFCKIEGFTYKETAEKMGISPHTVKEYLGKASNLVKIFLISNMELVLVLLFLVFLR